MSVNFAESSLKDQFFDGFTRWVSVSDVGFNFSEHIDGSFVNSNENSVMELSESEESHDSDDFWVVFVNTSDSNHKCKFRLSRYVDLSSEFSLSNKKITFLLASISALLSFW